MGTQYASTSYMTHLETAIPTLCRPMAAVRQTRGQVRRMSSTKLPVPPRSTISAREPAPPRQPPRARSPERRAGPPPRAREIIALARLPEATRDADIECPSRPPRARSPEGRGRRKELVVGMLLARISVSAGEPEVPREPPRARSVRLELVDGDNGI